VAAKKVTTTNDALAGEGIPAGAPASLSTQPVRDVVPHGLGHGIKEPCFSWMRYAVNEYGVKEMRGAQHHPRILEYHAATTLRGTSDEIPWCSSFTNWVMKAAGYNPTRSAAARSWLEWGQRIRTPIQGCIVVLSRDGGGHVGFYVSEHAGKVQLLGGNQGDAVSIASYDRKRVLAYVLPRTMTPADNAHFYTETAKAV